jgi:hypothetical protein
MLPPEINQLTVLRILDLSGNQLRALPPGIGRLTALQNLDLSGNQLNALPPEIGQLTALLNLDLRDNQLSALPPEIAPLTKLMVLVLSGNQLITLPPEIGRLKQLAFLDLSNNQLRAIPVELGQVRSLAAGAKRVPEQLGLSLDKNPLPPPYPVLIRDGQPSATANVLAWLRNELDPTKLQQGDTSPGEKVTPPPEIPTQGYGPHFEVGDDGIITFAPPDALDRQGNNVARLEKLHPSLRSLSSGLVEVLGRGNIPHRHLRDRADAYRILIDQKLECIDLALLYVEGVRLANAEKAAAGD